MLPGIASPRSLILSAFQHKTSENASHMTKDNDSRNLGTGLTLTSHWTPAETLQPVAALKGCEGSFIEGFFDPRS